MGWADDPELLATFTTEVEDRIASLIDGLQRIEIEGATRTLVSSLFRDAHTVKGSARMLSLDDVVGIAHRAEDVLGALRDGRVEATSPVISVLLVACTAIRRGLPDASEPLCEGDGARVMAALDAVLEGGAIDVPVLSSAERIDDEDEAPRSRGESVRVPPRRLYDLLDVVGEAELEVRRIDRRSASVLDTLQLHVAHLASLRQAASRHPLPPEVADAVHGLVALEDQLVVGARELRSVVEDTHGRLAEVRGRAMHLAMVPLRRVAAGFPHLVRDVAQGSGKDVRLVVTGEDVELDSRVLDGIAEALGHLLTNAVDHGCETPEQRRAAGKPPTATVNVQAKAAGATVVLEVSDDGYGIDNDAVLALAIERGLVHPDAPPAASAIPSLLFVPGFSTRQDVTSTSGRGIGLDAVRLAVEELGGSIDIESELGHGTRFTITLPVTLGVMRCLMARVGTERYALPLTGVVETVSIDRADIADVAGAPVLVRAGSSMPLADLGTALGVVGERDPRVGVVVRVGSGGESLVWAVDGLDGEAELVVKELGAFLGRPHGVSGATIDGDGSVVLLLDVRELAVAQVGSAAPSHLPQAPPRHEGHATGSRRPRVLVVEDSIGVRELERVVLEGAGYEVLTAVDGLDGARRLSGVPVDIVVSDVEMPGMDGFTFTRTLRGTRGWEDVPVVIMTSRGDDADQRAGLDAGASAYLLKSEFDQHELVETVRRLVGR
jgi:chemotaxis protein histidine kinase CheA